MAVPLPPIAEQQEIVRRVKTLFKTADEVHARYELARARVDKLQRAIRAKAFRGELVAPEGERSRAGQAFGSGVA